MSNLPEELSADALWNPCTLDFGFQTTASLGGEAAIIGQERAVQAIDFGVGITSFGFNIYALGGTGTGRATTIHTFLSRVAAAQPVPDDLIYVHNFTDETRPNAVRLPPGTALPFRADMEELVADLLREIPRAFESESYDQQKEQIVRQMQQQSNHVLVELEQKANERGFTLVKSAMGLGIAPVLNGQVLTPEAYQQLDEQTRQTIEQQREALQGELVDSMRTVRDLEKNTKRRLQDYDREIADFAVRHLIEELQGKYGQIEEIPAYLAAVHADIVNNVAGFKGDEAPAEGLAATMEAGQTEALLKRYRINVIVDHSQQTGAPVIFEPHPTYGNLVGRIEHHAQFGALVTDFTMIRAGALHRANGGYLIAEMGGLLSNPLAWDALKRAIKNGSIRTEEPGAQLQVVSTVTLEPEPIPLAVKVVLIGDPETYYLLHEYDEDFRKLFKVQADFGIDFDRTDATCLSYAQFVAARCHQEGLIHFDPGAVSRIVEYGSRLAENQKKLSTRFGEIADLVREASYWAKRANRDSTTAEDVEKALAERIFRASRSQERLQEMIDDGTILLQVSGQAVGQVNGLSVMSLGDYAFGIPSRITVRTYAGRAGVVALDREAKLTGRIYDKGVLTLTGYLGGKYALSRPLSLSASISFEQSYQGIEGDSASSAELYALLSSLSGLPLEQGIAATGSVDQQGNIQPVGGVNEKIEGFFRSCRNQGLTGSQGVILPARNVIDLMLIAEVRQAVETGQFHIYPVNTLDEGLEILTHTPAGELQADGTYPEGTLHTRVMARLAEIAASLDGKGEEENEEMSPPGQPDNNTEATEEGDSDSNPSEEERASR